MTKGFARHVSACFAGWHPTVPPQGACGQGCALPAGEMAMSRWRPRRHRPERDSAAQSPCAEKQGAIPGGSLVRPKHFGEKAAWRVCKHQAVGGNSRGGFVPRVVIRWLPRFGADSGGTGCIRLFLRLKFQVRAYCPQIASRRAPPKAAILTSLYSDEWPDSNPRAAALCGLWRRANPCAQQTDGQPRPGARTVQLAGARFAARAVELFVRGA
jgi:hypothetical protein